jgi:hypothetical protein
MKMHDNTIAVIMPANTSRLYRRFRWIWSRKLFEISVCFWMENRFCKVEFSSFSLCCFRLNLMSLAMSSHS